MRDPKHVIIKKLQYNGSENVHRSRKVNTNNNKAQSQKLNLIFKLSFPLLSYS